MNIAQDAVVWAHCPWPQALSVCNFTRFLLAQSSAPSGSLWVAALSASASAGPPHFAIVSTVGKRPLRRFPQITDGDFKQAGPMIEPCGAPVVINHQDAVQVITTTI